jgi:hypothetical protein
VQPGSSSAVLTLAAMIRTGREAPARRQWSAAASPAAAAPASRASRSAAIGTTGPRRWRDRGLGVLGIRRAGAAAGPATKRLASAADGAVVTTVCVCTRSATRLRILRTSADGRRGRAAGLSVPRAEPTTVAWWGRPAGREATGGRRAPVRRSGDAVERTCAVRRASAALARAGVRCADGRAARTSTGSSAAPRPARVAGRGGLGVDAGAGVGLAAGWGAAAAASGTSGEASCCAGRLGAGAAGAGVAGAGAVVTGCGGGAGRGGRSPSGSTYP